MARVNRILDLNLLVAAGTLLSGTSAVTGLPVRFLRDQLRSKVWRTGFGWTIYAGINDKIDFNRGGVKSATIAPATYATAVELCAAVVAALEAADAGQGWACTYSGSPNFFFTISASPAFVLLFGTGANIATDVAQDMGYPASDTASATFHNGGGQIQQGIHWLLVDLGTSQPVTAAALFATNLGASATVTLGFSATSAVAAATAPTTSQSLTRYADAEIFMAYFGSVSSRYLAFKIADQSNVDGFVEVGIAYAGTYRQPAVVYSIDNAELGDDLSEVMLATEGAPYGDLRPEARAWQLDWKDIEDADAAMWRSFRTATPKGKCFFFDFDATDNPGNIIYGYRNTPLPLPQVNGRFFNPSFTLQEALP